MTPQYHTCDHCGVADGDVIWSHTDASYLHSAYVDFTSSDQCIAALKRENAAKQVELESLRVKAEAVARDALGLAQEVERLREAMPRVAIIFGASRVGETCHCEACTEKAYAAFQKTDAYTRAMGE